MHLLEEEVLTVREPISNKIVDDMLKIYIDDCKYLKSADISYRIPQDTSTKRISKFSAIGKFYLPFSYYVAGTGHFNASELIICLNQLSYVMLAQGIEKKLLDELNFESLDEFKGIQLGGVYIAKAKDIVFKRPIKSKDFEGVVEIGRIMRRENTFLTIDSSFYDSFGGEAHGSFLVALCKNKC